jgi:hypothetical protein
MANVGIAGIGFDSWVKTIRGSLWRSIHFYSVIIFNLNVALGAVNCCRAWSRVEYPEAFLSMTILVAAVVWYSGDLMYSLYIKTQEAVSGKGVEGDACDAVLTATFVAYRIYLGGVGAIGCCLQLASYSVR